MTVMWLRKACWSHQQDKGVEMERTRSSAKITSSVAGCAYISARLYHKRYSLSLKWPFPLLCQVIEKNLCCIFTWTKSLEPPKMLAFCRRMQTDADGGIRWGVGRVMIWKDTAPCKAQRVNTSPFRFLSHADNSSFCSGCCRQMKSRRICMPHFQHKSVIIKMIAIAILLSASHLRSRNYPKHHIVRPKSEWKCQTLAPVYIISEAGNIMVWSWLSGEDVSVQNHFPQPFQYPAS